MGERLTGWLLDTSLHGFGVIEGAIESAARHGTSCDAIDDLIRWTAVQAAAIGFGTNLGGLMTLPFSMSADIAGVLALQTRMIATIAIMKGHDPKAANFRAAILLCLVGTPALDLLKGAGITVGQHLAMSAIKTIPGSALIRINKAVGMQLLTKAGTTGVVNFTRMVPLVGSVVAAGVDGGATYAMGKTAKRMFGGATPPGGTWSSGAWQRYDLIATR